MIEDPQRICRQGSQSIKLMFKYRSWKWRTLVEFHLNMHYLPVMLCYVMVEHAFLTAKMGIRQD